MPASQRTGSVGGRGRSFLPPSFGPSPTGAATAAAGAGAAGPFAGVAAATFFALPPPPFLVGAGAAAPAAGAGALEAARYAITSRSPAAPRPSRPSGISERRVFSRLAMSARRTSVSPP